MCHRQRRQLDWFKLSVNFGINLYYRSDCRLSASVNMRTRLLLNNFVSRQGLFNVRNALQSWRLLGTSTHLGNLAASSGSSSNGFLREAYHCNSAWKKRLDNPILKNINSLGKINYCLILFQMKLFLNDWVVMIWLMPCIANFCCSLTDDFFYDIDKRYQSDKVISAIDVDLVSKRLKIC